MYSGLPRTMRPACMRGTPNNQWHCKSGAKPLFCHSISLNIDELLHGELVKFPWVLGHAVEEEDLAARLAQVGLFRVGERLRE